MEKKKNLDSVTGSTVVTKVLSVANKLAPIAGVVHGFLGDPMADGRGIAGAPDFIYTRVIQGQEGPGLLQGHIGNPLITTQIAIGMPDKYPIIPGVAAAIGGWLAEKVGGAIDTGMVGQVVSGFGKFFKRYGIAAAASATMAGWLYLSPFNDAGAGGPSHTRATGYSRGVHSGGAGATNAIWQTRGGAQIRNSAGAIDVYPT